MLFPHACVVPAAEAGRHHARIGGPTVVESLDAAKSRISGLYVSVPTFFRDDDEDFPVDVEAIRRHVDFLIDGGCVTGKALLLAAGAAGEFSTLTFDERVEVAQTVVTAAAGRVPVVMGGQTTSTLELKRLARAASSVGATYLQVSPPFYFAHTEGDFLEYVQAVAKAAPDLGLIIYNTYWTSYGVSSELVQRLTEIPSVLSLKWATPDNGWMEFGADGLDLLRTIRRHRQPAALGGEPHAGRSGRGKLRCQLLAAVGHRALADAR